MCVCVCVCVCYVGRHACAYVNAAILLPVISMINVIITDVFGVRSGVLLKRETEGGWG